MEEKNKRYNNKRNSCFPEREKQMNNWQRKYDSPQHAIEGALKALEINRTAILKHGVSETAEFILGDKVFTLNKRGFLKK